MAENRGTNNNGTCLTKRHENVKYLNGPGDCHVQQDKDNKHDDEADVDDPIRRGTRVASA